MHTTLNPATTTLNPGTLCRVSEMLEVMEKADRLHVDQPMRRSMGDASTSDDPNIRFNEVMPGPQTMASPSTATHPKQLLMTEIGVPEMNILCLLLW